MDQRGKQDRHLIRSGLVVIAGGLADDIEQPLSLGAVLAWTSHHDLRLPGYSLLKRHIPRAAGNALRPRASPESLLCKRQPDARRHQGESRADHENAPDLSEPQEPRKLNSIVAARRAQLSQPAGHHDHRALVAEEFPVMGGQRIG